MFIILGIAIALGIPALIAAAVAFAMPTLAPGWSLRRRSVVAALIAGFLPMTIPVIAALSDPANPAVFASVSGILFGGVLVALVIGLPVALLVGRRRGGPAVDPTAFD
ncbi:MAG TPA: hypothetical protein VFV30_08820 [Novosphingobium sp.]|nr:hypothetical protein [Novosphingobium sp.]